MRPQPLPYRSLQVGLSGETVDRYVDSWTVAITDVTPAGRRIRDLLQAADDQAAAALLPVERAYPLPARFHTTLGTSPTEDGD